MKAFHNDIKVKEKYLSRVRAHQKADNLIRGQGWSNGKGCAVGCTLENYDHSLYPKELGVPEWLARVEDELFEGMTLEKSKTWPEVFLDSILPGVDLEKAKAPFMILILENCLKSMDACVYDRDKNPNVKSAIDGSRAAVLQIIDLWKNPESAAESARSAAWSAAWSAAESARSAAESAAESARSAAWSARSAAESARSAAESARSAAESARSAAWSARSAAESAARSAAESAWSAAWSAAESARSAAWSARSAAESAARSAAESAWSAAFDYYADELIRILKELK